MPRASSPELIARGRHAATARYAWPLPVVTCGCARAQAPSAAEALTRAIAALIAELGGQSVPAPQRAIVVGTHTAARAEVIRFAREIAAVGATLVNPALFPLTVMNAPAGLAAIDHQCEGPNVTLCNGATSAADALVYAADLVAAGRATLVFAGGFETRIDPTASGDAPSATSVSFVTAVTSEAHATAGSLPVRARLVATASGPLGGLDPATIAAELAAAARHAPSAVDAGRAIELVPISHPEEGLLALADLFTRISSEPSPALALVVALADHGGQSTALLVGSAGH